MARRVMPAVAVDDPRRVRAGTIRARIRDFEEVISVRARMSDADRTADTAREFLRCRADYYGADSDWARKLKRWHRDHPNWPIGGPNVA